MLLTTREKDVLELLVRGKRNKIIAYQCGMTENTVKIHVRNIMKKFGAFTRSEIVAVYYTQPLQIGGIYLSGPMTGLPEYNYPEFNRVAALLRERGHRVFNPAEYWEGSPTSFPVREAFAAYARFICLEASRVVMLPGWQQSRGAMAEYRLAQAVGVTIEEWKE